MRAFNFQVWQFDIESLASGERKPYLSNLFSEGSESYPEILSLHSTKHVYKSLFFVLGIYIQIPEIKKNGKPIWKHVNSETFLFFDGELINHSLYLNIFF